MTPKFDNYINTLLENEHEKEGMSTAKKAALGVGAAAALGGLGYLAGKKLGGNVGGKIGQLKGQVAGAAKDAAALPGKELQYKASQASVAAARAKQGVEQGTRAGKGILKSMLPKFLGGGDIPYQTGPYIPDAVKPDYKEFVKKLGAAGLQSGTKTGAGLGAVAGGTAGATAGAVGAHLATKDKKEKNDK